MSEYHDDFVPYQEFETCPEGTLVSRIVAAIDLGMQSEQFGSEPPRLRRKLFLVFEVVDESARRADGSPFFLAKEATLTMGPRATLQQITMQACGKIDPRKFVVSSLLGKPLQLQIAHKETEEGGAFARVTGTTALHARLAAPPATREPLRWRMGDDLDILRGADWLPRVFGVPVAEVVEQAEDFLQAYGSPVEAPTPAVAQSTASKQSRRGPAPAGGPSPF